MAGAQPDRGNKGLPVVKRITQQTQHNRHFTDMLSSVSYRQYSCINHYILKM